MIQPCPHRISCLGLDYPIVNLSSEDVERAYWRSIDWCCNGEIKEYLSYVGSDDAILGMQRTLFAECDACPPPIITDNEFCATRSCPDGSQEITICSTESQADADIRLADAISKLTCDTPPPGSFCATGSCADGTQSFTVCSDVSQEDADAMAAEIAAQLKCDDGGSDTTIYYNTAQTCEYTCPDGSEFAYTLAAGMVAGASQAEANYTAYAYACAFAYSYRFCLGALATTDCCQSESYSDTISVSPSKRVSFSLLSGTLPPGLSFVSGWSNTGILTLSGTPTTAGNYTFTILASDVHNAYTSRSYTICVVGMTVTPAGITLSKFPDATEGTAYTATLSATSCADTPLSWQITAGALPAGLSLDESTGAVTGTPTEDGDFTFTITLQTQAS